MEIKDIRNKDITCLSNDGLKKHIKDLQKHREKINCGLSMGELNQFLDNAYYEQRNRRLDKLNKKTSQWTLGLAGASMLFSIIAVGLSVGDYFGDENWKKQQIAELKKISNQDIQNNKIIELLGKIKNKKIIIKGAK